MFYDFVLLSGGIDSTTCLYRALEKRAETGAEVRGVSIDYGQRHKVELECAKRICEAVGVSHTVLDVGDVLGKSLLTSSESIPDVRYADITGASPAYVPFRNGFMLSVLTAYVHNFLRVNGTEESSATLHIGTHAEDARAWAYADCTPEFIGSMASAIHTGTYSRIRLVAPLLNMSKTEVIQLGARLGVPFAETWSCYAGGNTHCGKCPTCYSRQDSFASASIEDPTSYA